MTENFEEELKKTVEKMVRIVRGKTGGSRIYGEMLLSLLPNSSRKVQINYWLYKADSVDEEVINEFMQNYNQYVWTYVDFVEPYVDEVSDLLDNRLNDTY